MPRFAYIPGIQPSDSVAPPLGPAVPPGLETEDEFSTNTFSTFTFGTQ